MRDRRSGAARDHRWMVPPIAGFILTAILTAGPAAAQCPTNRVTGCWLAPSGTLYTNAPSYSGGGHCGPNGGDASASYDLTVGTFSGFASGPLDSDSSGEVLAQDEYQIVGPPGPDSVHVEARFTVSGGVAPGHCGFCEGFCAPASITASIALGPNVQNAYVTTTCVPSGPPCSPPICSGASLNTTLVLLIRMPVNQPFVLQMFTWAHASWAATSSVGAQLTFAVPAGYSVVSCQGFTSGEVVAAHSQSWGRLKILYRR